MPGPSRLPSALVLWNNRRSPLLSWSPLTLDRGNAFKCLLLCRYTTFSPYWLSQHWVFAEVEYFKHPHSKQAGVWNINDVFRHTRTAICTHGIVRVACHRHAVGSNIQQPFVFCGWLKTLVFFFPHNKLKLHLVRTQPNIVNDAKGRLTLVWRHEMPTLNYP